MRILIAAKQNQKFPFHFLSAPPTPPAEEKKKGKENFWFLLPRPKGAGEARRLERTIQFRATTRSAREISSFRQDYSQNEIELCLIHTARNRNRILKPKRGRVEGATLMHSPPPNPESKRVFHAPRGSSFANTIL